MNKIGGSNRVREELTAALAEGRGVTAKVRWVSRSDEHGRNKWIHCTPLIGANGQIGVWMVVIVDDDNLPERWSGPGRPAPPVSTPETTRTPAPPVNGSERSVSGGRSDHGGMMNMAINGGAMLYDRMLDGGSAASGSVTSLRIG